MTNSEAWGQFFSALGATVEHEGSHVVVDGLGGERLRLIHADYPPTPELISAAAALSDLTENFVMVLFGMPHLPAVRLRGLLESGKMVKRVDIDKSGVAMQFVPPSRRTGDTSGLPRFEQVWYCLQEDAGGNLAFWSVVVEKLPVGTQHYVMNVQLPTLTGELVPSVYEGTGLSPYGPRLVRALEAVGLRTNAF